MVKVKNMCSPVSGREVANQFVISGDGKQTFQSYDSMIVEVDLENKTITIGIDYDYSNTTNRYRCAFFRDYTFSELRPLADRKTLEKALSDGEFGNWKVVKAWVNEY